MVNVNYNAPYIIVDNKKIYPTDCSSDVNNRIKETSEDHPFGIVDRVTISNEAREKSKTFK